MGLAKYYEDDNKIIEERAYSRRPSSDYIIKPEPLHIMFSCSVCDKGFKSKSELFDHMKICHNRIETVVLLNGQIIRAGSKYYIENISSLKVVRYELKYKIVINGLEYRNDENETDLTGLICLNQEQKQCELKIGNQLWNIELITKEAVREDIIEKQISEWGKVASNNIMPHKSGYEGLNVVEKDCLDGFYDYFVACNAKNEKNSRYNDAWGKLSKYSQVLPQALFVLKIIAFKNNWLEKLDELCVGTGRFAYICDFFTNKKSDKYSSYGKDRTMYVEDDIERSIDSIVAFQEGNYEYVDEYLNSIDLNRIENCDSALYDRIRLLRGRIFHNKHDDDQARREFRKVGIPFYENKWEEILNNKELSYER